jgi:hypothetical protein
VTAVLHRLRDVFVAAPADGAARPARAMPSRAHARDRALPSTVGVLCAPGDVAAAFAAGLVLASAAGGCALVCRWTAEAPERGTASELVLPAAAALARRLRARDLAAAGAGRLVGVDLPAVPGEARTVAVRAAAAAGDVPVVLAVAGPRPAELDDLLASHDRLLVVPSAGAAAGLADLALTDAARVGRAASLLTPPWGAAGRALAVRGLVLPRALRAATLAALEGRDA